MLNLAVLQILGFTVLYERLPCPGPTLCLRSKLSHHLLSQHKTKNSINTHNYFISYLWKNILRFHVYCFTITEPPPPFPRSNFWRRRKNVNKGKWLNFLHFLVHAGVSNPTGHYPNPHPYQAGYFQPLPNLKKYQK